MRAALKKGGLAASLTRTHRGNAGALSSASTVTEDFEFDDMFVNTPPAASPMNTEGVSLREAAGTERSNSEISSDRNIDSEIIVEVMLRILCVHMLMQSPGN